MPENNEIVDLMQYKKIKALKVYERLDPAIKKYLSSPDRNITKLMEKSFDEIPDDLTLALEYEDEWPEDQKRGQNYFFKN